MELAKAEILCKQLMQEHGCIGWRFQWMKSITRLGECNYGPRTIRLSVQFTEVHPENEVRDTILHEIAHAKKGHKAGHGPEWRQFFMSIGGSGRTRGAANLPSPKTKYVGRCPQLHEFARGAKSDKMFTMWCGKCARVNSDYSYCGITWFVRETGLKLRQNDWTAGVTPINGEVTQVAQFTPIAARKK